MAASYSELYEEGEVEISEIRISFVVTPMFTAVEDDGPLTELALKIDVSTPGGT